MGIFQTYKSFFVYQKAFISTQKIYFKIAILNSTTRIYIHKRPDLNALVLKTKLQNFLDTGLAKPLSYLNLEFESIDHS